MYNVYTLLLFVCHNSTGHHKGFCKVLTPYCHITTKYLTIQWKSDCLNCKSTLGTVYLTKYICSWSTQVIIFSYHIINLLWINKHLNLFIILLRPRQTLLLILFALTKKKANFSTEIDFEILKIPAKRLSSWTLWINGDRHHLGDMSGSFNFVHHGFPLS